MKTSQKFILSIIASIVITFLIYNQLAGFNVLLTSLLLLGVINFIPEIKKKIHWFPITLILISSTAVAIHGNTYSLILWCVSLIYLAGSFYPQKFNVLLGIIAGIDGYLRSCAKLFIDLANNGNESKPKEALRNLLVGISIIVVVPSIFFLLYRESNAVFDSLVSGIDSDFDFGFVCVAALIFYLMCAFCFPAQMAFIQESHQNFNENNRPSGTKSALNIQFSIFLLFIILNILIAFVNTTDLVFLWGGAKLPEGVTFAQMIHQGVETLIIAIIFTIVTILIGFGNGRLSDPKSRKSVMLAYVWIGQTLIMVLSNAYRNLIYVMDYDLTQKRLGIWLYLILVAVGLITTMILLNKKKTTWYLFRVNTTVSFAILVLFSPIHWDRIIMDYDMYHAENNITEPDYYYLLSLSPHTYSMMEARLKKMKLNDRTASILRTVTKKRIDYEKALLKENIRSKTIYDYVFLKEISH